jgi:glutamate-1-semialdehyde 2,1-aminomutase
MKDQGQKLYQHAKNLIPGGNQLLSKRPEMILPENWPSYYDKASGVEVWDLDGNRYLDMSYMGVGACLLGYADPDVDSAVKQAVDSGSVTTLNCPEEVTLAELLCELHPWAEMVRYARGGGEAMAIAVRIARAHTGRDKVAFCGYHGWHDWYLAANLNEEHALDGCLMPGLAPAGVPRGLRGTALPFSYNHTEELEAIVAANPEQLAAIIIEPIRSYAPLPDFLPRVREIAAATGAVLVVDEVSAGFRLTCGGAHLVFDLQPDIAVFAKGMSNGYPMAAVIGTAAVMQAAQESFISSTYWTERIGPTAALATIQKHRRENVTAHLDLVGRQVQQGWSQAAQDHGLAVNVWGIPPLGHFVFEGDQDQRIRTLFTQQMLALGFLATNAFYASYAHKPEHVTAYLEAVDTTFGLIADAMRKGDISSRLKGPPAHTGFRRLA